MRTEAISAHVCQISPKEFGQIIPKVSPAPSPKLVINMGGRNAARLLPRRR